MFPVLVIAIGIAVLTFGKRLAVLGAAVGALIGLALLGLFSISTDNLLLAVIIVGGLALGGFLLGGFTKVAVNIVLLVLGTLAGAAIVRGFLDLFNINSGLVGWLFVVLGGVAGLILVRRYKELALVIFAGLVGGLLVTRGLTIWFPVLDGALGHLIVLVLAGGGIAYQGGFLDRRKAAAQAQAAAPSQPAAPRRNLPCPRKLWRLRKLWRREVHRRPQTTNPHQLRRHNMTQSIQNLATDVDVMT